MCAVVVVVLGAFVVVVVVGVFVVKVVGLEVVVGDFFACAPNLGGTHVAAFGGGGRTAGCRCCFRGAISINGDSAATAEFIRGRQGCSAFCTEVIVI